MMRHPPFMPCRSRRVRRPQRGAGLVETLIAVPTLLFMGLGLIQYGLVFHAKSQVNYAAFEAARAGSVSHADIGAIKRAFGRALIGYYGGGETSADLAKSYAKAMADLTPAALRIEILSPTKESFTDYSSPELQARLSASGRVIPNSNVAYLSCPIDAPSCANDPKSNQSGQTLADANLLKLRITYGIPAEKQMPLVGKFYTWALSVMNKADPDAFRKGLAEGGRIPIVAHTTVRMQSPAIENSAMASIPGAGDPHPSDPGETFPPEPLPTCSVFDPSCASGGDPPPSSCGPLMCCAPL